MPSPFRSYGFLTPPGFLQGKSVNTAATPIASAGIDGQAIWPKVLPLP